MTNDSAIPTDELAPSGEALWPVRKRFPERNAGFTKGEYWGYINRQGDVVLDFQFTYASPFHEGLASVRISSTTVNQFGFIDRSGELVIKDKLHDTSHFAEGLCRFQNENYEDGFIDRNGRVVVPAMFDCARDFSDGLSAVEMDGRWGAIDVNGNAVIPMEYAGLGSLSEGLAVYSVNREGKRLSGYIDRDGAAIIPARYAAAESFSEGLGLVYENRDGGRQGWGFVDASGEYRLGPFEDAHWFHEGLAPFRHGNRWGFINQAGEAVIPAEYTYVKRFSEGLAGVYVGGEITPDDEYKDGKWGFINCDNTMCVEPTWDDVDAFAGGLCEVEFGNLFSDAENHTFGYINSDGDYVWPPS